MFQTLNWIYLYKAAHDPYFFFLTMKLNTIRLLDLICISVVQTALICPFYFHAGLEPAVFAALVPNSADKTLQELIEEVMGDHEMLVS